jgi:hypothetical protein
MGAVICYHFSTSMLPAHRRALEKRGAGGAAGGPAAADTVAESASIDVEGEGASASTTREAVAAPSDGSGGDRSDIHGEYNKDAWKALGQYVSPETSRRLHL